MGVDFDEGESISVQVSTNLLLLQAVTVTDCTSGQRAIPSDRRIQGMVNRASGT